MKKTILFVAIILSGVSSVNAQKIEIKKKMGTNMLYQNDAKLSFSQTLALMKTNTDAYQLMKSAKTNMIWGSILGGVGGALIGFPIGTSIGGGKANWTLAAVGAGVALASIPLNSAYNKKSSEAVTLYNAGISATSYQFKPTFHLNVNGSGLGLAINF